MTFYDFVIQRYSGKDSPAGDLAYDMKRTRSTFPTVYDTSQRSRQIIKSYLKSYGACRECIETFDYCWRAYRKYLEQQFI